MTEKILGTCATTPIFFEERFPRYLDMTFVSCNNPYMIWGNGLSDAEDLKVSEILGLTSLHKYHFEQGEKHFWDCLLL